MMGLGEGDMKTDGSKNPLKIVAIEEAFIRHTSVMEIGKWDLIIKFSSSSLSTEIRENIEVSINNGQDRSIDRAGDVSFEVNKFDSYFDNDMFMIDIKLSLGSYEKIFFLLSEEKVNKTIKEAKTYKLKTKLPSDVHEPIIKGDITPSGVILLVEQNEDIFDQKNIEAKLTSSSDVNKKIWKLIVELKKVKLLGREGKIGIELDVPYEKRKYDDNKCIFELPIEYNFFKDNKFNAYIDLRVDDSHRKYELSYNKELLNKPFYTLEVVEINDDLPLAKEKVFEQITITEAKFCLITREPNEKINRCLLKVTLDVPHEVLNNAQEHPMLKLGAGNSEMYQGIPIEFKFARNDNYFKEEKFDNFIELTFMGYCKSYHVFSNDVIENYTPQTKWYTIEKDEVKSSKNIDTESQPEINSLPPNKDDKYEKQYIYNDSVTLKNNNLSLGKSNDGRPELLEKIEKIEKQLEEKNNKIESQKNDIDRLKDELKTRTQDSEEKYKKKIKESEEKNTKLEKRLTDLENKIQEEKELNKSLEEKKNDIKGKTEELEDIKKQIEKNENEKKQWEKLIEKLYEKEKEIENLHEKYTMVNKWNVEQPASSLSIEDSLLAILSWSQTYNDYLEKMAKANNIPTRWIKLNNKLGKLFEDLERELSSVNSDSIEKELISLLKKVEPDLLATFNDYYNAIVKEVFPNIYEPNKDDKVLERTEVIIYFLYPYFQLLKALEKNGS